jgi:hypothetical protein
MPSEGKKGPNARGPKKGVKEGSREMKSRPGGSTGMKKKGKG